MVEIIRNHMARKQFGDMLKIALLGCGRIGALHAENIMANANANLCVVYDIIPDAAHFLAQKYQIPSVANTETIAADPEIDAVLIATATDSHADLIEIFAKAGKAILCEKPIDTNIERVETCAGAIAHCQTPIQIGFNRRFDPGHRAAYDALQQGIIGQLHQIVITSRDPEIPPRSYMQSAGGLLRDMTIHDFDLARFFLDEEPCTIFAIADALGDPSLAKDMQESDSAMIIMQTPSGKMCHINNSRSAVYGYDQRIELLGSAGMIISGNRRAHEMEIHQSNYTAARQPLLYFFMERYQESYRDQLSAFISALANKTDCQPDFEDGRRALLLANAAYESIDRKSMVRL